MSSGQGDHQFAGGPASRHRTGRQGVADGIGQGFQAGIASGQTLVLLHKLEVV